MGGGLAFLTKKSFNPANWSNQRQVWEARQKHATEERAIAERHAQLGRERDEEDLARAVGGDVDGGRKALGFMYEAGKVPGLERKGQDNEICYGTSIFGGEADEGDRQRGGGGGAEASVFERQAGDDDAAAAFRAMLAQPPPDVSALPRAAGAADAAAPPSDGADAGDDDADGANTAEDDKNDARDRDQRTNLEKAVGRGINAGSGVTLTQQFERFPMLKSAPMVLQKPPAGGGGGAEAQSLNFKPLGQVLRNVQCLKCREWGHARGDRECKLSGWDPFAVASVAAPAPGAAHVTSDPAPVANAQPGSNSAPTPPAPDHRKHKKKERRRTDDGRKKKKHRHKRRRRHERSPSYSSSSSASSLSTQGNGGSGRNRHAQSRGRHRRHRQDADADDSGGGTGRRSRQEPSRDRRKSSSRRHGTR